MENDKQTTPLGPPDKSGGSETPDGFLPFYTNLFDRGFIAVVILIGIHLLWLRFAEPPLPEPTQNLWLPMLISLAIGYVVMRKG